MHHSPRLRLLLASGISTIVRCRPALAGDYAGRVSGNGGEVVVLGKGRLANIDGLTSRACPQPVFAIRVTPCNYRAFRRRISTACREVVTHRLSERDRRLRPLQPRQEWDHIAASMAELLDEAVGQPAVPAQAQDVSAPTAAPTVLTQGLEAAVSSATPFFVRRY